MSGISKFKTMKTEIKQFTAGLAAALLFAAAAIAADRPSSRGPQLYDITTDWSNTANPNGAWSYNQNAAPISQFQTFWWGQPGWGYSWIGEGCILKAGAYPVGMIDPWGNALTPAHDWKAGDVVMHAVSLPYGGDTTFANITWTSPADGTININGRAWDAQIFPDRDVSWSLIVGGNIVAQRSSTRGIFRKDKAARFSANQLTGHSLNKIPVSAGEVVEFRVAAATYYGHFVGIQEQITFNRKGR
jgi:hypothetical protein